MVSDDEAPATFEASVAVVERLRSDAGHWREIARRRGFEVERLTQERNDMRASAQMYAATVDDQIRIIGDLRDEVARLRHLEDTAHALLRLKDGPRDSLYQQTKEPAWSALRSALAAVDALPVEATDGA